MTANVSTEAMKLAILVLVAELYGAQNMLLCDRKTCSAQPAEEM